MALRRLIALISASEDHFFSGCSLPRPPRELELIAFFKRHLLCGSWGLTTGLYPKTPLCMLPLQLLVKRSAITKLRSMIRGFGL